MLLSEFLTEHNIQLSDEVSSYKDISETSSFFKVHILKDCVGFTLTVSPSTSTFVYINDDCLNHVRLHDQRVLYVDELRRDVLRGYKFAHYELCLSLFNLIIPRGHAILALTQLFVGSLSQYFGFQIQLPTGLLEISIADAIIVAVTNYGLFATDTRRQVLANLTTADPSCLQQLAAILDNYEIDLVI